MEAQARLPHVSTVPPENDWPCVPRESFEAHAGESQPTRMIVEKLSLEDSRGGSRDTEGLSMDDIAAAHALEDLRAGNYQQRTD